MKMYLLLILSAIMLSFMTAYHFIGLQNKTVANPVEIQKIFALKQEFIATHKDILELDLSAMYPSRRYAQLFAPVNVFSKNESNTRAYFSSGCQDRREIMSKLYYNKSETWEDFRCQKIDELPPRFFEDPPYIHETGLSYVFLAYRSNFLAYTDTEWVRNHLNLFHVNEIAQLPVRSLEPSFKILAKLNKKELDNLTRGIKFILTDEYYLTRDDTDFNVTYKVYNRQTFENFLKSKNFFLRTAKDNERCYFKIGKSCLEKDNVGLVQFFQQSSITVLSISIVILVLIAVILFKKIRESKFEEERKRHALRVLTHELRTPIANLMLLVEEINKQSYQIPNSVLEDFLRLESEVYRLKRLAEKSSNYLQHHEGKSFVYLHDQWVESFNGFLAEFLSEYEKKNVHFHPYQGAEISTGLDVYWFGICVKNLVENALHHGKGRVDVSLYLKNNYIMIEVKDEGVTEHKRINDFFDQEKNLKHSRGLGLGLSLVDKIVKEMGGKLVFKPRPTRFYLVIKKKEYKPKDMIV